jgi:hypothetical protein
MSRGAETDRAALVLILQKAYSGEQAAALAYRGHWRSLRDPAEAERVRAIEAEEWHHRELVGALLAELGAAPDPARERRTRLIGRVLSTLCGLSGWLLPMYAAGLLESRNIVEYEDAARHARGCGREAFLDCLLAMAETEWDHERYFRERVQTHALRRVIPLWPAPPPRAAIRGPVAA